MDSVCNTLCNIPWQVFVAGMVLEAWLGRTNKVKSGSLLELAVRLVLAIPQAIIRGINGKSV